jgi:spermidine synthase
MRCRDEMDACIKAHIRAARSRHSPTKKGNIAECVPDMCLPFVRETRFYKSLHFSELEAQSRMMKQEPDRLVLDYTRTMMAFLLFNSQPDRIAMLGLGGGSLAKFCYRELSHSRIDVVEINAHVVALRKAFQVPADDERFHIHLDDGARYLRTSRESINVLLVDAYTRHGIPAHLASVEFYESCQRVLHDNGVIVLNLYCKDADVHIDRMRRSFGDSVFAVDEEDGTNRVVFAFGNTAVPERIFVQQRRPSHIRPSAWSSLQAAFLRTKSAMRMQCPG